MTFKSVSQMSKDERLKLGGKLIERKEKLIRWREQIHAAQDQTFHPMNAYDVSFYGVTGISMSIGNGLVMAESDAFTAEMRTRGIERHKAFAHLALTVVTDQIAEIDQEIERL